MQLREWLAETNTPLAAFASRIGVANASVVARYANGRVPRQAVIREAIVRETKGRVTLAEVCGHTKAFA